MTYIIAEVGVNHNGRLKVAIDLIEKAKEAGADCVKFQTFTADKIVTKASPKASYQLKVTDKNESQYEMLKKLELKLDDYKILIRKCHELNIDFLSTPYNKEDVDFLEELQVPGYKIASGQLTEIPFLKYVASKQKRMIISTGMATLSDVFDAVEAIRFVGNNNIVVLQCTTNYPSLIEDANLLAMKSISESCGVETGYSDHVQNNFACYAAVALGAKVIEKHFTLDRNMPGPDHSSSLNPEEFKDLVMGIRQVEKSLGSPIKKPSNAESQNIYGMKRSLVASYFLTKGTELREEHIGFKRPANGLEVNMFDQVIGKILVKDMDEDEPFQLDCIKW
jgi:N-acetylneuraminate synthase/N,N'-diacetyllegionaminate synthase